MNASSLGSKSGFITGFAMSFIYKTPEYAKPVVYEWQKLDFDPNEDAFMKHFDENGNFVNNEIPEEETEDISTYYNSNLLVNYTITNTESDDKI